MAKQLLDYDNPPFKPGDIVRLKESAGSGAMPFRVDRIVVHNDAHGVDSWMVYGTAQDGPTGRLADFLEHVDAVTRLGWVTT